MWDPHVRPPAGLDEGPSYRRGRLAPPSRPLPWPPLATSWEEQSVYVSSDAPDPPRGAQETARENPNATRNLAATRAPAPSSMASSPTVPHTLARDRGPAGQHRAGRELGVRTGRLAARAADLRGQPRPRRPLAFCPQQWLLSLAPAPSITPPSQPHGPASQSRSVLPEAPDRAGKSRRCPRPQSARQGRCPVSPRACRQAGRGGVRQEAPSHRAVRAQRSWTFWSFKGK